MKKIMVDDLTKAFDISFEYSCKPDPDLFPNQREGDIIDEEQSVRWNRKEVARRIQARKDEVKRLNAEKNDLYNKAVDLAIKYIQQETKLNEKKARLLWSKVYDEHHAYFDDVLSYLDDEIEFVQEILKKED